ncbi:hypothetical protein GCM10009117_22830 [Gangjinia marincola]|uniref:Lipid/polyisoprenoid-binding YceI-like domain-containing protein n=1 Tax=Gangjinia marincola TaxID=578463 RepID=A0ABN1MIV6_9FLAO
MKTIQSLTLILFAATMTATATNPIKEKINVKESSINWTGKKLTGSHNGTIQLKSGYLEMDGDKITGGEFIVDMSSIIVTDLKAGDGKEKLEGHLHSDDFFSTKDHPTATLTIKNAIKAEGGYNVAADMTIKNITKPITFFLAKEGNKAMANVKIDRTKYNVRYGSGSFFDSLGDNVIYDDFELDVNLTF